MHQKSLARKDAEDKSLVSMVTPFLNQGQFIEETILSVKNQDYPNIEHIIVASKAEDYLS